MTTSQNSTADSVQPSVQPTASHFINGQYIDDPQGKPFQSVCPVSGEVIAELNSAGEQLINECVAVAQQAQ